MQTIHPKRVLFRGLSSRRMRQILEPEAEADGEIDSGAI